MGFYTRSSVKNWVTGSPTTKFVLMTMAEYANDDTRGDIKPSFGTIAKETEICKRSVIMAVQRLVEAGFLIAVEHRLKRPTIYRIPAFEPENKCISCTMQKSNLVHLIPQSSASNAPNHKDQEEREEFDDSFLFVSGRAEVLAQRSGGSSE